MTSGHLRIAALAAALAGLAIGVQGYVIPDATRVWADGNVTFHEQLPATGTLIDGSASLNVAFENALQTWNQYLGRIQLVPVRGSTVTPGDGDGANNVIMSDTVFGRAFEPGIIATSVRWFSTTSNRRTEHDIVFNSTVTWNSFRGPRRTGTYDIFRIALRQLGLGLGLNSPDLNGQTVTAIMNDDRGDIDTLAFDDIAGITSLYGSAAALPAPSNPLAVQQFTAETDADGIATFSPTGGRPVPVRFADEDTGAGIPGANAYLFTDANGIAIVALADPYRRYFTQMAPVRLPLIVTAATTPAGVRPIEVPVPSLSTTATPTPMSMAADWVSRTAMDAWIPVQQRATDLLNAATSAGFVVDKQVPLSGLTDLGVTDYIGNDARDRSLGIMVEARGFSETLLWKGFERAGTATALRDGFWNVVRFGLTERGYREDQVFRVRVARILPVNTSAFLRNFNEWQIYVSPTEVPRGNPSCEWLGADCPVSGVLSGRLYDYTTGLPVGGNVLLNGGQVRLNAGSNGLFASRPIKPGLYTLTAQARNYRTYVEHMELAGDGRNTTKEIALVPVGIDSILIAPPAQTIRDNQSTTFTATAYAKNGAIYTPTPRFIWHSDNPAAATVDAQTGVVRGVRAGTARISAQAEQMTGSATLTVERSAPCTYAVTPSGYTATANGGTGGFTITTDSDCTWTAVSQASYITVTSSTAATPGSGTVRFSVAANTTTAQRIGTLLIAGTTVRITQAGATPTPTPTPTPSPSPSPAPSGSGRYDGTYDFTFTYPQPGGAATRTLSRFFIVTSGTISSNDRTVSGSVTSDSAGSVRFTGPCWTDSGGTATWVGTLTAGTTKSGSGTYTCQNGILGGTWSVSNGR